MGCVSSNAEGLPSDGHASSSSHSNCSRNILEFYKMDRRLLGKGFSSSVCKGTHKATGTPRAIKVVSRSKLRKIQGFDEANIMRSLDHPNIIRLIDTFEDPTTIYLVLELCTGGELFDQLVHHGSFSEQQAAGIMQQVFHAISHIHLQGICHSDLKPENMLFAAKAPIENCVLKVSDFGMAKKCVPGEVLTAKTGSVHYAAPEVLTRQYTQAADVWSCGIIMYTMLAGYPPFSGPTDSEVLDKVRKGEFGFPDADWRHVSEDAQDLISALIRMDPKSRCSVDQALSHVWLKNFAPNAVTTSLPPSLLKNLQVFHDQSRLKRTALRVVARELNENELRKMHNLFVALDVNGDGLLTFDELRNGFPRSVGEEFGTILDTLEKVVLDEQDWRGKIAYTEFMAAALDARQYTQDYACRAAFNAFDRNGDGMISVEELAFALKQQPPSDVSPKTCAQMLHEVDTDGDGKISYPEFLTMMIGSAERTIVAL